MEILKPINAVTTTQFSSQQMCQPAILQACPIYCPTAGIRRRKWDKQDKNATSAPSSVFHPPKLRDATAV